MIYITDSIFRLLSRFLLSLEKILGWDYEKASVYICIYLWPVLLCCTTIPIVWKCIIAIKAMKCLLLHSVLLVYCLVYPCVTIKIWRHYNQPTIVEKYDKCYNDLITLSEKWRISYELVNLLLFVGLFIILTTINICIYVLI